MQKMGGPILAIYTYTCFCTRSCLLGVASWC